jgi:localization factor PodJL
MTDIEELRRNAEAGNVVDQSVLGICYLWGYDVERDYAEAFKWLTQASSRGAPRAMVNLGTMYERGLGTPINIDAACALYEQGALAGEFFGNVYLARIFANGIRGSVDEVSALKWYRQAAEMRNQVMDCEELQEAQAYVASHSPAA